MLCYHEVWEFKLQKSMSVKVGVHSGVATVRALATVKCLLNLEAIPCTLLPFIRPYYLESNSMRSDF